ncbi:MAG: hypothetical protein UR28_C0025G0013 [Candidatus Peregrinibacteria bacterium GW2011_GWF2_33_10]|nr:MAG: hypothetical protein UR28_C0025G0013 [Candidatus Peregrinibacteria bacterium GW2011_GWF2_33_10]OGJ45575.1 MAG: hypothetical protein A2263_00520 [Candidatus Peregrinibacteria bacterium RIFOXYA2_FULL_33_21]OGJ45953.1 MAG: hypothetical protein A2272_04375 [Candidatus Peregrinibacteria bacterium RIFOXYA12_FULL_33_12]OGJ51096.1 MAG: hypothetical protein A2307_06490 [Candidatus Peregrinibacteria bacterium RIFOXYB2_FULL_33_20]
MNGEGNKPESQHLLYPKQIKEEKKEGINLDFTRKPQANFNISEIKDEDLPPQSIIKDIAKTLSASVVFFLFFIFLGTLTIVISNHYHHEPLTEVAVNLTEDFQIRNKARTDELKTIKDALEQFYNQNANYPKADELTQVLIDNGYLGIINPDPLDKAPFRYIYAVYNNNIGEQQSYILSASLEDKNGIINLYTIGSPTIYHRDFRDVNQTNISYIPNETSIDNKSRVKVKM